MRSAATRSRQLRFEEEARAASALNHPNVLTVYDVGTLDADDGSAFLVMELLEGHTLRSRLQEAPPLPRELVIDFGAQVARGLDRSARRRDRPSRPQTREPLPDD